jgi:peptidoglycan DL-endopeptidase CwlO
MRLDRFLPPLAVAVLVAALGAAPLAASPAQKIKEKQRQADVVLAQVNALDNQLNATVEAWDGAQYELGKVKKQLAHNRASLAIAERAQRHAEELVQARLVTIYESDQPTTIDVVLGSTSLGDLIDRLQAARSVATSDRELAQRAAQVRDQFAAAQRTLQASERHHAASVAKLSSQRQQIGAMLAQRRRLLASVQTEITTMRAEEARRQAALAAAARRRLEAEQAALRRQAAEREQAAAAAAAARAAAKTAAPATTTTTQAATTTTESASAPATAPAAFPVAATTTTPVLTGPVTATSDGTTDPTTTTTATPAPPVPLPAGHPEAATIALRYLGVPYLWGGESPKGFDCSGLVAYVYAQLGITLPHFAAAQYQLGAAVPVSQLQPGDLVFFDALNHVGIYIGGGEFVHAPHTGDVVKITSLASYISSYVGARRI